MVSRLSLPHIGTDIVHIPRIHKLIQGRGGVNGFIFVEKLLNPLERHHWRIARGLKRLSEFAVAAYQKDPRHPDRVIEVPTPEELEKLRKKLYPFAIFLSGRWAAKEAAVKAYYHKKPISRQNVHIYAPSGPRGVSLPPFAYVTFEDLVQKTKKKLKTDGWYDTVWGRQDWDTPEDHEDIQKHQKDIQEGQEDVHVQENQDNVRDTWEALSMDPSEGHGEKQENKAKTGEELSGAARPTSGVKGKEMIRLSISHDNEYATAVCIVAA